MLKKNYTKTRKLCRVTFKLPADAQADSAFVCGEFNDWDRQAAPMKPLKNGSFSATLSLPADQSYRFRYLLNGDRWENDSHADAYVANGFGTEDSIVSV